jgi:hypothetical protein
VLCVWRNGHQSWETREFLDGLQGADDEVLKRAESIAYLEFYLPHPDLREVTLVDTPGTDAIVGENDDAHQRVANEMLTRRKQLQARHSEETRRIAGAADAVIYLVGQVAHVTNRDFLQEFQEASSGKTRALNAVGVMSKIDGSDQVLEKRHELAKSIADKLSAELNTVVPVSAALWRATALFKEDGQRLRNLQSLLRSISATRLDHMLTSDRAFLREYGDCPIPVAERKACLAGIPWRVFVLFACALYEHPVEHVVPHMESLSGFIELRQLLEHHFFRRGRLLRCFRILSDLHAMLDEIKRSVLYEYKQRVQRQQKDLLEFTDFIIEHPRAKSDTANRLRRFLSEHQPQDNTEVLDAGITELLSKVEDVQAELEIVNRQFQGLQWLDQMPAGTLSDEELQELRELFGLYASAGMQEDPATARKKAIRRQLHWRQDQFKAASPMRRQVAELAVVMYGLTLRQTTVALAGK